MTSQPRHASSDRTLILIGAGVCALCVVLVVLYPLSETAAAGRPYDIEQLSRERRWAAWTYVLVLALLFGAQAWAIKVAPRARRPVPIILGFGALAGLVLVGLYPLTATDLFHYVLRARIFAVHDANPLMVAPSAFPAEPLLSYVGEWKDQASPYGPAWELLTGTLARTGLNGPLSGALLLKGVAWIAFVLTSMTVAWGAGGAPAALLIFAWNPLILLQGPGNGHNDMVMLLWMVLAVVLWQKRGWWGAAAALVALAVTTKAAALLIAPLLLIAVLQRVDGWGRRLLVMAGMAITGAAVVALLYVPFWPPWDSIVGIFAEMGHSRTYTITALSRMVLVDSGVAWGPANTGTRTLALFVFAMTYLWAAIRMGRGRSGLAEAAFWVYFIFLFTAAGSRIWYATWCIPFAALAVAALGGTLHARRITWRAVLISLTFETSILMYYLVWRWVLNGEVLPEADWTIIHLVTVPWQFGIPLLVPLLLREPVTKREL